MTVEGLLLLIVFMLVIEGIVGAMTLGMVWALTHSHNRVHERLKHPFHLHGPVK